MKKLEDMTLEELERERRRIEARQAELRLKIKEIRFNQYPKEVRAIMKRLGWAPEDADKVIRRTCGSFTIKK